MPNQPLSKNDEVKNIMDSYSNILDIWKVQNDNYFKRVQVFMGVLQAGLFFAALKLLSSSLSVNNKFLFPIGILGFYFAILWIKHNIKEMQYLEFSRRVLRNLEARLAALNIPLEYFNFESLIFRPDREMLNQEEFKRYNKFLCSANDGYDNQNKQLGHWLDFKFSKERFPEPESNKNIYSINKVSGGLISYEKGIAWGFLGWWCLFIVILFCTSVDFDCNVIKALSQGP